MTLRENIKAILESNFSETKEEIIEIATESILKVIETTESILKVIERRELPYDAMGDYSSSTDGNMSADEWYRENFGAERMK